MPGTLTITVTTALRDSANAQVNTSTTTESYTLSGPYVVTEYPIPNNTTDQQLNVGQLAANGALRVVLFSDRDVTLKVGATTGVDTRLIPANGAIVLAFASGQANYYVTNTSGGTATLRAVIVR